MNYLKHITSKPWCAIASTLVLLVGLMLATRFPGVEPTISKTRYCDSVSRSMKYNPTSCIRCPQHGICSNGEFVGCKQNFVRDSHSEKGSCVQDTYKTSRVTRIERCADFVLQAMLLHRFCYENSILYRVFSAKDYHTLKRMGPIEMKHKMSFFCPGTTNNKNFHIDYESWLRMKPRSQTKGASRLVNSHGFVEFIVPSEPLSGGIAFVYTMKDKGLTVPYSCLFESTLRTRLRTSRILMFCFIFRFLQVSFRWWRRKRSAKRTLDKIRTALKSSRNHQICEDDVKLFLEAKSKSEREKIWHLVERFCDKESRIRIFPEYKFGEIRIIWEWI